MTQPAASNPQPERAYPSPERPTKKALSRGTLKRLLRRLTTPPTRGELARFRQSPRQHTWQGRWARYRRGSDLVLREFINVARTKDLQTLSSSITYSFILALVPLLAIAFTFFKVFGGLKEFIERTMRPLILRAFQGDAGGQLASYLEALVENLETGTLGAVSFVTFFITVISLLMTIETSFNTINDVTRERSLLRRLMNYWALISLTPLLIVFSTAKSSQLVGRFTDIAALLDQFGILNVLRYLLAFSAECCVFAFLYAVLPARKPTLRAVLSGGLCAALLFELLQRLNYLIVRGTLTDSTSMQIYGSAPLLAVAFFIWIRLVWVVILVGACLAVAMTRIWEGDKVQLGGESPAQGMLHCALVFAAVCDNYRRTGTGVAPGRLASQLSLSPDEAFKWVQWLKRQHCISSLSDGRAERLIPTFQGLGLEHHPHEFVTQVLRGVDSHAPDGVHRPGLRLPNDMSNPFTQEVARLIAEPTPPHS